MIPQPAPGSASGQGALISIQQSPGHTLDPTKKNGAIVAKASLTEVSLPYSTGDRVRIVRLKNAVQYNNRCGIVITYDGPKLQYAIQLDGDCRKISVKTDNLESEDTDPFLASSTLTPGLRKPAMEDATFNDRDFIASQLRSIASQATSRGCVLEAQRAAILSILSGVPITGSFNILELGSGDGYFSRNLCPDQFRSQIIQSEPCEELVQKILDQKNGVPIINSSIQKLSRDVKSGILGPYQLVIDLNVLNSRPVDELDELILNIKQLIEDKGTFLCISDSRPDFSQMVKHLQQKIEKDMNQKIFGFPYLDSKGDLLVCFIYHEEALRLDFLHSLSEPDQTFFRNHFFDSSEKIYESVQKNPEDLAKFSRIFEKIKFRNFCVSVNPKTHLIASIQEKLESHDFSVYTSTETSQVETPRRPIHDLYPANCFIHVSGSLHTKTSDKLKKDQVCETSRVHYLRATLGGP
jgi:phospholipid N-methyltransferase